MSRTAPPPTTDMTPKMTFKPTHLIRNKNIQSTATTCSGQSSEWEERQKSRLGEGALCARRRSRKTVTCHCLCVVEPVYIRPCCAADGGTGGGELRGRASLVTLDVLTGHICSLSFCFHVQMERDKYVWLVQSRRRPEKWTRIRRAGSRGSATPDPVS